MNNYFKISKLIKEADALVIGAGAGLSASAGINYGTKGFKEHFPELVQKYGMTDMYTSSFYSFASEEERWSYWAKHINYLYNVPATDVYKNLYELVKQKPYFVITTNVDGQFLKAGFEEQKVFEVQGSLAKVQCSVGCHNKLYNDLEMVRKMLRVEKNCRIPTSLVPKCPRCGDKMEVNLRKDAFFVEDEHWFYLQKEYDQFIASYQDKKIVFLELGVGFNTPGIIRFPFEEMTRRFLNATLIRVNDRYFDLAFEIQDKAIFIQEDCGQFITNLKDNL